MGTLMNVGITHYGSGALAQRLHDLLNQPEGLARLTADPSVRSVFDLALRWSFVGVVILAVLTFVATWLIPVVHRTESATAPGSQTPQPASH